MAIKKEVRLAQLSLGSRIILPYADAIKVMEFLEHAEELDGWGDSNYKIKDVTRASMEPFSIEKFNGIKKAQLLGTTYEDYLESLNVKPKSD